MKRGTPVLLLLLAASACGGGPPIPPADLLLRVTAGSEEVETGKAFPLTVVRVWSKQFEPQAWDDRTLAPLVVRLESENLREDDARVEETRVYRGYAMSRSDVVVRSPSFTAQPKSGGAARTVKAEGLRFRVKSSLDAKAPGAPELPGEPEQEPSTWPWWLAGGAGALALLGAWFVLRRRPAAPPAPPPLAARAAPAAPHIAALDALQRLRERTTDRPGDRCTDVAEVSDIVRAYAAERFAVRTAGRTSEELLAAPTLDRRDLLAQVLGPCDSVKFAAHLPTTEERAVLLDAAEVYVRATAPGAARATS